MRRRSTWSPGERPRTTRADHERPTRAGDPAAGRLVVSRVSRPRGRARGHRVLSRVLHGRGGWVMAGCAHPAGFRGATLSGDHSIGDGLRGPREPMRGRARQRAPDHGAGADHRLGLHGRARLDPVAPRVSEGAPEPHHGPRAVRSRNLTAAQFGMSLRVISPTSLNCSPSTMLTKMTAAVLSPLASHSTGRAYAR